MHYQVLLDLGSLRGDLWASGRFVTLSCSLRAWPVLCQSPAFIPRENISKYFDLLWCDIVDVVLGHFTLRHRLPRLAT